MRGPNAASFRGLVANRVNARQSIFTRSPRAGGSDPVVLPREETPLEKVLRDATQRALLLDLLADPGHSVVSKLRFCACVIDCESLHDSRSHQSAKARDAVSTYLLPGMASRIYIPVHYENILEHPDDLGTLVALKKDFIRELTRNERVMSHVATLLC